VEKIRKARFFSVELKSKVNLKNVTLTNGGHENVLLEGTIGELQSAEFSDDIVLVIDGDQGILRVSLSQDEIKKNRSLEEVPINE
jgi:hypothetical protein